MKKSTTVSNVRLCFLLVLGFSLISGLANAQYSSYSIIETFAGDGQTSVLNDGNIATNASLNTPRDVAIDAQGNVYIADALHQVIRKIDATTKIITTIAGTGTTGFSGDGGLAILAELNDPAGLALDAAGNLFIADRNNNRVRRVDVATGIITTVTGGIIPFLPGPKVSLLPNDLLLDAAGNLYIADAIHHTIFILPFGATLISPYVGQTGRLGFSGDGSLAISAEINLPHGMLFDNAGNFIFCDKGNNLIRSVSPAGIITTIAGNIFLGGGYSGDGGRALLAKLNQPDDIALAPDGSLLIADLGNNRMRMINPAGIIYTVAGTGATGFSGDGGQATQAELNFPDGMAVASDGKTYISDQFNHRIRTFTMPVISNPGALPLILISFEGRLTGGDVDLNWATTSETNTASFTIERSSNGRDGWESIGSLPAAGFSSIKLQYTFTDRKAMPKTNFYRLRQIDKDQTYAYSKIIQVTNYSTGSTQIGVYPNPFAESLTINIFSNKKSLVDIDVLNAAGQVQIRRTVTLNTGTNMVVVDQLNGLTPGMYFVKFVSDGKTVTQKIIKQ